MPIASSPAVPLLSRCLVVAFGLILPPDAARGETFVFGFAANQLNALSNTMLTEGAFSMQLAAGPAGAQLYESNGAPGLGIGTSGTLLPDGEHLRFELNGGVGEFIQFSFDRPGILTGLDFDGVKDENYEYFLLQTVAGSNFYFFDSFEGSAASPGLIDVPGRVVFLLESFGLDDSVNDLRIPFVQGQQFTLSYGELPVGNPGNGARLQSITVLPIPEPGTLFLALWVAAAAWASRDARATLRVPPSFL
jgi:hypothetical protein